MDKFIAVSEQARDNLDRDLAATTFGTVDNFITLYNEGLINKSADLVREILPKLIDTYKDVEEKSRMIIFLDPAEVYLNESMELLEPWQLITKIKREVSTAMESGQLNDYDQILFTDKETGYLCKMVEKEDGSRGYVKIGVEKLFYNPEGVEEVFEEYSTTGEGGEGNYSFNVTDFTHLDDSFIQQIHNLIPRR